MQRLLILIALGSAVTAHAQTYATIDTPTAGRTSEQPAVAIYQNQANIFVSDRDLATGQTRLKWCRPSGVACTWTVIDGAAGDLAIPAASAVKPVVWSGDQRLHLFYINRISGSGVLRHAVLTTTGWYFENFDGAGGGAGRIVADLGGQISAVDFTPPSPETPKLFVSYFDATNTNLRIARVVPKVGWSFATIDGDGAALGRINGNVGVYSSLVVHDSVVNVLYADSSNADLRHARLVSNSWTYQTIDGNGGFTHDYVVSAIAAVAAGTWLHIMYNHAASAGITHGWSGGGGSWSFAHHDGDAAAPAFTTGGGCSDGNLMYFPYSTGPFSDADLKVTSAWPSSPWNFSVWDGHSSGNGRIVGNVGLYSACAGQLFRAYFVYTHDLGDGRKAIRYTYINPPV